MPSPPIRRVGTVLISAPEFEDITRHAKRLLLLQRALTGALPKTLADHATVANLNAGNAVVFARNGTVAAKLKQMSQRLLIKLREQDPEINAIQVQVQEPIVDKPLPQKQISLSSTARQALDELSNRLQNSPLRSSVEGFSQRAETQSEEENKSVDGIKYNNNQYDKDV